MSNQPNDPICLWFSNKHYQVLVGNISQEVRTKALEESQKDTGGVGSSKRRKRHQWLLGKSDQKKQAHEPASKDPQTAPGTTLDTHRHTKMNSGRFDRSDYLGGRTSTATGRQNKRGNTLSARDTEQDDQTLQWICTKCQRIITDSKNTSLKRNKNNDIIRTHPGVDRGEFHTIRDMVTSMRAQPPGKLLQVAWQCTRSKHELPPVPGIQHQASTKKHRPVHLGIDQKDEHTYTGTVCACFWRTTKAHLNSPYRKRMWQTIAAAHRKRMVTVWKLTKEEHAELKTKHAQSKYTIHTQRHRDLVEEGIEPKPGPSNTRQTLPHSFH